MPQFPQDSPRDFHLPEIARYFTSLGFTAFGGPAVHIAMMEEELVERRHWLDRQKFLDLVALINCIPGPNSTQLAIALGRLRGGWRGLILAGLCFILPAVLIILPIAWLYVTYGQLPQITGIFRGIGAAVVAVLAAALWRFARSALRNPFTISIALAAVAAEFAARRLHLPLADLAILILAGALGSIRAAARFPRAKLLSLAPQVWIPLAMAPLAALPAPLIMVLIFLQIGSTIFGSGYVLITYLQSALVDHHHWLTQRQLLDAIAVGQITPGPVLTTSTFVGLILGRQQFHYGLTGSIACALAATAAIFAPSFVLVAILGPWMRRLSDHPAARYAMDAMSAAVVGLIAFAAAILARQALQPPSPWTCAALMLGSLLLLTLVRKANSNWIILAAALAGWLLLSPMRK